MAVKKIKKTFGIDAKCRTKNSLFKKELDFETTVLAPSTTKKEQNEIDEYVKMRFKERTFDNYEYKVIKEEIPEEVYNYELCTKNQEIMSLWEDIEECIDRLTYFK